MLPVVLAILAAFALGEHYSKQQREGLAWKIVSFPGAFWVYSAATIYAVSTTTPSNYSYAATVLMLLMVFATGAWSLVQGLYFAVTKRQPHQLQTRLAFVGGSLIVWLAILVIPNYDAAERNAAVRPDTAGAQIANPLPSLPPIMHENDALQAGIVDAHSETSEPEVEDPSSIAVDDADGQPDEPEAAGTELAELVGQVEPSEIVVDEPLEVEVPVALDTPDEPPPVDVVFVIETHPIPAEILVRFEGSVFPTSVGRGSVELTIPMGTRFSYTIRPDEDSGYLEYRGSVRANEDATHPVWLTPAPVREVAAYTSSSGRPVPPIGESIVATPEFVVNFLANELELSDVPCPARISPVMVCGLSRDELLVIQMTTTQVFQLYLQPSTQVLAWTIEPQSGSTVAAFTRPEGIYGVSVSRTGVTIAKLDE